MRFGLIVCAALLSTVAAAETSEELKLALQSLRPLEQQRIEKALGPVDSLPLYRVDLKWLPKTRTATGTMSLTIIAKTDLREVNLRVPPNANLEDAVLLSEAKVNGAPVPLSRPEPSLYRVKLGEVAPAGSAVRVEVKIKARVPKAPDIKLALDGAQSQKGGDYGAFSAADEVACLAGIVPSMAPIIDGVQEAAPSGIGDLGTFDPSNWIVGVSVPNGYSVVAPGIRLGDMPEGDGTTRFTYALAGARELPILVTHGYEVKTTQVGDITIESHYEKRDEASGKDALEIAASALNDLNTKLGPYPFKTFRVVEARLGSGAGGMEFPGLITISAMLYRGAVNPLSVIGMGGQNGDLISALMGSQMQSLMSDTLEFTIDHEVAHQYFAMLVGNDPIAAPVVDEPLTQHVALLLREWHHGAEAADQMRSAQLKAAYQMFRLMGGADMKANRSTAEFGSNIEYAALIYGKAPLLFDAQRNVVGDAAWMKVLKTYVAENRYRWAGPKTLTQLAMRLNPTRAAALENLRRHWWEEAKGDEDIAGADMASILTGGASGQAGGLQGIDPKVLNEYIKAMQALTGELQE